MDIINGVVKKLGRSLSLQEKVFVLETAKLKYKPEFLINYISNQLEELQHDDLKERKITELPSRSIVSFLNLTTSIESLGLFNPLSLFEKGYVVFDSNVKNTVRSTTTSYSWDIINSPDIITSGVNILGNIQNLIAIKIYQFSIQIVTLNASNVITMLIDEFSSDAYSFNQDRKYHFMFRPEPTNAAQKAIELRPVSDYTYKFKAPISNWDTFTVNFGNPENLISFRNDSNTYVLNAYLGDEILCTRVGPKILASNFYTTSVIISGFTTNDPLTDDTIIKKINRPEGFVVFLYTEEEFVLPNILYSEISDPIADLEFTVYFNENRLIIPAEFTFLKN